jgi:hypothetical protein
VKMNPAGIWQRVSVEAQAIEKVVAVESYSFINLRHFQTVGKIERTEVITDPTIACDEKPARKISVVRGSAAVAAATPSAIVVKSECFNIFSPLIPSLTIDRSFLHQRSQNFVGCNLLYEVRRM